MKKTSIKTSYQFLLVKDLRLAKYQRPLEMSRVKKYASEFDKTLLTPIVVSKRNGFNYVVDGQHRTVLAKTMGLDGLMALVYEGLTYEEEADYFKKLNNANGEQKKVSKIDMFNASVEAKDIRALDIKAIIEDLGFRMAKTSGNNTITAMNTLEKMYDKYGAQGLKDTLILSKNTWNGETYSLNNQVISGLASFLNIYSGQPNFSAKTFIKQLSSVPSQRVHSEAKGDITTRNFNVKIMNTLLKYYNLKLRKRLENKHYSMV
ncbi:MAG: hypothetical protein K0R54_2107 [Clostridiaceae bacterium]|jgi:hypothetical protein|nr:hypothetical protein [Clostridiaceae bacterium]